MKRTLAENYRPLTANFTPGYREFEPCDALRPYIRCFWVHTGGEPTLVVPDTCMDILIKTDGRSWQISFCGINDFTYESQNAVQSGVSIFGIRFHFWAAASFAAQPLDHVRNTSDRLDFYFPHWREALLALCAGADIEDVSGFFQKIQSFLLDHLHADPIDPVLLEMAHAIVLAKGNVRVSALQERFSVDARWMQRRFLSCFGVSCQKLIQLVRYQFIWQKCLETAEFDLQMVIDAYGFYDQAHLLHFFRKYHGARLSDFYKTMPPNHAILFPEVAEDEKIDEKTG